MQMEEDIQTVERRRKQQATWNSENSRKPYLMYLSLPEEQVENNDLYD